jgi:hypothetical protein
VSQDTFEPLRPRSNDNLKNRGKELEAIVGSGVRKRASLIHSLSYYPGFLSESFGAGFEKLPPVSEPAPILCFSHKKIHDVMCIAQYMLARPVDRFHDFTFVAQGGLFHGIFPYQDLVPDPLKIRLLGAPLGWGSRLLAKYFRGLFMDINAHPVYRDGSDVPLSEDQYRHPDFAGPWVTGMSYEEFLNYTRKQTARSVLQVQKDMVEKNRSFVILPEGRYCHDGRIAELLDLAALAAFRKQRDVIYISLAYDELCPDARGRIDSFCWTSGPISPPPDKTDFKDFMHRGRTTLQETTTITASSVLAAVTLQALQESRILSRTQLEQEFHRRSREVIQSDFKVDPRLEDGEFRLDRFSRFISRKAGKWFAFRGEQMHVRTKRILDYDDGERTVPDILWNLNSVIHAVPLLKIDPQWLDPEHFRKRVQ